MSGICGLVHVDGAIDAARVERMTSWLERCGPDARGTWRSTRAAFGHTLLDTGDGATPQRQPCTLDGVRWIVADARIDGRAELIAALAAAGERVDPAARDASPILHAWRAWGESCPERLLGDFAFAVWDAGRRTLFCARDPLGIKPFFYAEAAGGLAFANALACLRSEGGVPDGLDEVAIADFLLFELSQDAGSTAFRSIRRLPAAHCLTLSPDGMRLRRYWRLPQAQLPARRPEAEVLEEFDALLDRAVADRIGSSRVGVLMSGGLDSPAIASIAARHGRQVQAFCTVYDRILPDTERHYAAIASKSLGIPIRHLPADDYGLFERYRDIVFHFPEPANAPFGLADVDLYREMAAHGRVALTGWDGDTLLSESPRPYFRALARKRRWLELAGALGRFARDHPSSAARSVWLRLRGRAQAPRPPAVFPGWLNEDLVSRLRLRERWIEAHRAPAPADALRPYAHRIFDLHARSSNFFEPLDCARSGAPLELRHPMFDLRVVDFCMSLATSPWCIDKSILRRWLRGRVPEAIRRRPKTPLAGYPHLCAPPRPHAVDRGGFDPCEAVAAFIDRGKMLSMAEVTDPAIAWMNLRPRALDLWMRHAKG